jgi:hypothetical protein
MTSSVACSVMHLMVQKDYHYLQDTIRITGNKVQPVRCEYVGQKCGVQSNEEELRTDEKMNDIIVCDV